MTGLEIINLLMRIAHIVAVAGAVGGSIFIAFVAIPGLSDVSPEVRVDVHGRLRRRWAKIVAASIAFLLISGVYNIYIIETTYKPPKIYHMLFGIKFMLAFVVFFIASALAGRSALAERLRANLKFWVHLNLVLAIAVICISSYLRSMHTQGLPLREVKAVSGATETPE